MSEMARRLGILNLSEMEAQAYLDLLVHGTLKPSEVASDLRRDRAQVTRMLEDLARRGFVSATLEKPVRYTPVEVDSLFDVAEAERQAQRAALKEVRAELQEWARTRRLSGVSSAHILRIIHGRVAATTEAMRMIERATQRLLVVTTRPQALRFVRETKGENVREEVARKITAGLQVRVISTFTAEQARAQTEMERAGADFRHLETDSRISLMLVDGREALLWSVIDESERQDAAGDVAFYTTAPDLIRFYETVFGVLAEKALPLSEFRSMAELRANSGDASRTGAGRMES